MRDKTPRKAPMQHIFGKEESSPIFNHQMSKFTKSSTIESVQEALDQKAEESAVIEDSAEEIISANGAEETLETGGGSILEDLGEASKTLEVSMIHDFINEDDQVNR